MNDALMSRRTPGLRLLIILVVARSVFPGVVRYRTQTHVALYVSDVQPQNAASSHVSFALALALCAYAGYLVAARLKKRPVTPFLLALLVLLHGVVLFPGSYGVARALDVLAAVLVAAALWMMRPRLEELDTLGIAGAGIAAWSILQGWTSPVHAFFGDHAGRLGGSTKALIGSDQLAGPFGHSNTLGMFCALSLVASGLIRSRSWRLACVVILTYALVWSSSRSALAGAGILLVLYWVRRVWRSWPRFMSRAVAIAPYLLGLTLPFLTNDPLAFTSRGAIWLGSISAWKTSWLVGLGPDWYTQIGQFDNELGYEASSGHNLFIGSLTSFGIVGALIISLAIARAVLEIDGSDWSKDGFVVSYMVVLGTISILEYAWAPGVKAELFPVVNFVVLVIFMNGCDAWEKVAARNSGT